MTVGFLTGQVVLNVQSLTLNLIKPHPVTANSTRFLKRDVDKSIALTSLTLSLKWLVLNIFHWRVQRNRQSNIYFPLVKTDVQMLIFCLLCWQTFLVTHRDKMDWWSHKAPSFPTWFQWQTNIKYFRKCFNPSPNFRFSPGSQKLLCSKYFCFDIATMINQSNGTYIFSQILATVKLFLPTATIK